MCRRPVLLECESIWAEVLRRLRTGLQCLAEDALLIARGIDFDISFDEDLRAFPFTQISVQPLTEAGKCDFYR